MSIATVIDLFRPAGLRFGSPKVAGSLTVVPVHHDLQPAEYRLFTEVAGDGVYVEEVSAGGSVPELRVVNGSRTAVLLVEGEVLAGLKQNRTLNTTVLVPAGATVTIPVTCVEQGRWGRSAGHAPGDEIHLSPDIRKAKARSMQENLRRGAGYRSDQGEVWRRVSDNLTRHAAASPTHSYSDIHRERGADVGAMLDGLNPDEGQAGVLALIGRRPVALDVFDNPGTLASLWRPLVGSYAADALVGHGVAEERHIERAIRWVLDIGTGEANSHPAGGAGEGVQLTGRCSIGSALVAEGTVVHLAALRRDAEPPTRTRMTRPSSRRSWFDGGDR